MIENFWKFENITTFLKELRKSCKANENNFHNPVNYFIENLAPWFGLDTNKFNQINFLSIRHFNKLLAHICYSHIVLEFFFFFNIIKVKIRKSHYKKKKILIKINFIFFIYFNKNFNWFSFSIVCKIHLNCEKVYRVLFFKVSGNSKFNGKLSWIVDLKNCKIVF